MREILAIMKALADENRLRIVMALQGRELCLCQVVELLGLANSTVSRHLSVLQQARIVDSRKQGRWNYFRLSRATESAEAVAAAALVAKSLARDKGIIEDAKRLRRLLKVNPELLCRRQGECKC
jgi:DNA-binding transcriptional ArsR family regulator